MTTRTAIVLLVLAQGLAGCDGGSGSSAPSAPSPVPQPALPLDAAVKGRVVDTADRPLAGAVVEVVDGKQAGRSATSDATGDFYFVGSFDDTTVFRATKEGHVAATQSWRRVSGQPWLIFYLGVLAAPASISGDYSLTFTADTACTAALPLELRTRTYAATVTAATSPIYPPNTRFMIAASGADFERPFDWFSVGVAGDYLAFWLGDERLIEELADGAYLELIGSAVAVSPPGASTISASFDGAFNYCAKKPERDPFFGCTYSPAGLVTQHASCMSHNHQLVLTRN
jgi:hypothetical protein